MSELTFMAQGLIDRLQTRDLQSWPAMMAGAVLCAGGTYSAPGGNEPGPATITLYGVTANGETAVRAIANWMLNTSDAYPRLGSHQLPHEIKDAIQRARNSAISKMESNA